MKRYAAAIISLACVMIAGTVRAQEPEVKLQIPQFALTRPTLLRGAQLFVNHCLSCHTLKYLRYSRVGEDLGLTEAQVKRMLMLPANAEYNKTMTNTMQAREAAKWFGTAPPDLTLEARYRGTDWIYTYLKSFYLDTSAPLGWNNHLFPHAAMPNVLAPLGGIRDIQSHLIRQGSLNAEQFDTTVADITAWLKYTSDPSRLQRYALGIWVLPFLVVLSVLAYLLKRVYWRRIH